MDVDLVHRPAAEGEFTDKSVDGFLITAENESSERGRRSSDSGHRFIECLVGENWQDWTEILVFHDRIVPCDGINYRRIEVLRIGVGLSARDDLCGIDQPLQS